MMVGQLTVSVRQSVAESEWEGERALLGLLLLGLLEGALLLGGALLCLAPLPHFLGLPWLGTVFLAGAIVLGAELIIKIRKRK